MFVKNYLNWDKIIYLISLDGGIKVYYKVIKNFNNKSLKTYT